MKLRRKIAGSTINSKNNAVNLVTLGKLHYLVKFLPLAVKGEFELYITYLMPDFLTNPLNYNFSFEGESQTIGGIEEREVMEGTDGDDYLEAGDVPL